jgi:hypothetical protein
MEFKGMWHVREGKRRGAYRILVENRKERYHLENLQVGGRIILNCIFKKWHNNT